MPTVLRAGPYRFFFWSNESNEGPHVHVERDDQSAKFWLEPLNLASNYGFPSHELNKIKSMVAENSALCMEKWNEHFSRR